MGWPMSREIQPSLSRTLTEGDRGSLLTCWAATEGASRPQGTSLAQPLRRARGYKAATLIALLIILVFCSFPDISSRQSGSKISVEHRSPRGSFDIRASFTYLPIKFILLSY